MPRPAQRKLPPTVLRGVGIHPVTIKPTGEIVHHLVDAGGSAGGAGKVARALQLRALGKFRNMRIKGGRPSWELWVGVGRLQDAPLLALHQVEPELASAKQAVLEAGCMAMRWELWLHGTRDRVLWIDETPGTLLAIKPAKGSEHPVPVYDRQVTIWDAVPQLSRCVIQLVGRDGSERQPTKRTLSRRPRSMLGS